MAKKSKDEADFREIMLKREYTVELNRYIVFRLFAGAYQQAPREDYLEAVGLLLKSFEQTMKSTVTAEINKRKNDPGFDVEDYRINRYEAIAHVVEFSKQYLVSLNATPPAPQAGGEAAPTP